MSGPVRGRACPILGAVVSSSPVLSTLIFVGVLVVLLAAMVVAVKSSRRQQAADGGAQAKAIATGHPSAIRRPAGQRVLHRPEREKVALDLADLLTGKGMRLARPLRDHDVEVHVRGEDGDYVLHAGREYVHVQYRTNLGVEHLGQFMATHRAAQCVAVHAGLSRL